MDGSQRLRYEPLSPRHARGLFPVLADTRVFEYLIGDPPATVEEYEAEFTWREAGPRPCYVGERWWHYAVFEAATGQPIGRIEATSPESWAEVAYLFGADFWGRGYAAEAMAWLHRRLAAESAVTECWAAVLPGNGRSMRLLHRLGYHEVSSGWPALRSYDPGDRVFRSPVNRPVAPPLL